MRAVCNIDVIVYKGMLHFINKTTISSGFALGSP